MSADLATVVALGIVIFVALCVMKLRGQAR